MKVRTSEFALTGLFDFRSVVFKKKILFFDGISLILINFLSFFIAFYLVPLSRDFGNYEIYYNSLSSYTQDFAGERFEFGFQILAKSISYFFPSDIRVLYFVIISISLYLKYWVLSRLNENGLLVTYLFLVLYLISFLLVFEVNQVRASIAISFGLASLYSLAIHKRIFALLFVFIAFSFHYSAIVFLFGLFCIYFAERNKIRFLFLSIVVISIISTYLITVIENLNPIAVEYKKNYDGVNFGITSFTYVFALIFFLYHFINLKKESLFNKGLIMFLLSGLLFSITVKSIPVYAIRILEMIEVSCLLISINRRFDSYYDYGSSLLLVFLIFHKFVAYVFVNPLYYL